MQSLSTYPIWMLTGWTMVHFLWVGTIVVGMMWCLRLATHRAPAHIRYALALSGFLLMAAVAVITAVMIGHHAQLSVSQPLAIADEARKPATPVELAADVESLADRSRQPNADRIASMPPADLQTPPITTGSWSSPPPEVSASAAAGLRLKERLRRIVPLLPYVWLVGTPFTLLVLLTGVVGVEKLRHRSHLIEAGPVYDLCTSLREQLRVGRDVLVATCDHIATPLLIGTVRPLILLPAAAVTGWSPDQLEMVLVHELTHVRRWDNLVNVCQRIIEAMLFFHPGVWWLSRVVREEREACCDMAVIGQTGAPVVYANMLVDLAARATGGGPRPAVALGMANRSLAMRIRRILNLKEEPMRVSRTALLATMTVAIGLVSIVTLLSQATAQNQARPLEPRQPAPPAPAAAPVESRQYPRQPARPAMVPPTLNDSPGHAISGIDPMPDDLPEARGLLPSLAEQRAADLVWKLMRLDLEPLSGEELSRVKAKKFPGGVHVAQVGIGGGLSRGGFGQGGFAGGAPLFESGAIQAGDILVGLHSWTIKDISSVTRVLARQDLAQLLPLKFYVIRQFQQEAGATTDGDQLVTGRLRLNTQFTASLLPSNRPPPVRPELRTLTPRTPSLGTGFDVVTESNPAPPVRATPPAMPPVPDPRVTQPSQFTPPASPLQDDVLIVSQEPRFEGKTFDEWNEEWQHELSTPVRTRTVKAMAAFGAAGSREQATAAACVILEIVGQYDFEELHGEGEVFELQQACIGAFAPNKYPVNRIRAEPALPILCDFLQGNPSRYVDFARWVFDHLRTTDSPAAAACAAEMLRSSDASIFDFGLSLAGSLSVFCEDDGLDAEIRTVLTGQGAAPAGTKWSQARKTYLREVWQTIKKTGHPGTFVPSYLPRFPELQDCLCDTDERVSQLVRGLLPQAPKQFVLETEQKLIAILDDPHSPADRQAKLAALRALHIGGNRSLGVLQKYAEVEDEPLWVAAAVALAARDGQDWESTLFEIAKTHGYEEADQARLASMFQAEVTEVWRFRVDI